LIEFVSPTSALDFFQAMDHIERVQEGERYWDGAVHAFPAFFEAFHNNHLVGKIHPSGCDMERFRNTAPRVIQKIASLSLRRDASVKGRL
jgi:hypothetical protein